MTSLTAGIWEFHSPLNLVRSGKYEFLFVSSCPHCSAANERRSDAPLLAIVVTAVGHESQGGKDELGMLTRTRQGKDGYSTVDCPARNGSREGTHKASSHSRCKPVEEVHCKRRTERKPQCSHGQLPLNSKGPRHCRPWEHQRQ